uniref:HepT-like domain-containing protein n=1 Tax=Dictyoglomus thermophilum TaxID=14 RepID=A0A7C3MIM0_DICTH
MKKMYLLISSRIKNEIIEIEETIKRAQKAWELIKEEDSLYIDSVALNLHNFYSGLERIFSLIAKEIDGKIIETPDWHKELLLQMSIEIPYVRPAIISKELKEKLENYRAFRHVVRNIYAYKLKPEKIRDLITNLPIIWEETKKYLLDFCNFLEMQ